MTQQQTPTTMYTNLYTGLAPQTCHRVPVLDILVMAGFSKRYARQVLRNGTVLGAGPDGTTLVDFLDDDQDFMCLVVGKHWRDSSRAINLHARSLTRTERAKLWLLRTPLFTSCGWLLPKLGSLRS